LQHLVPPLQRLVVPLQRLVVPLQRLVVPLQRLGPRALSGRSVRGPGLGFIWEGNPRQFGRGFLLQPLLGLCRVNSCKFILFVPACRDRARWRNNAFRTRLLIVPNVLPFY
jgi:hypothetical protein